jgi:DNA modification methylase
MAKIDVTKAELVWPGKYNEDGSLREAPRVNLPFQVIERVNESRATRESKKNPQQMDMLFEAYSGTEGSTFQDGWRNKLIWGDNLLVMSSLLEKFEGQFDLIYIDPPFASGSDFSITTSVGDGEQEIDKAPSIIEEKAYRDTWGGGIPSYLSMLSERLRLMKRLLKSDGSILVHCDWHVGHLIRSLLDEIFGPEKFLNEIVWYYYNKFQGNVGRFASNHDVIFWYRAGEDYHFEAQKEKRLEGMVKQIKRTWDKDKQAIVNVKGPDGKVVYIETDVKTVDDVWRLSMLQPADKTENVGYQTQKPETLVGRIIDAVSQEGDLVGDFFIGSGTTLVCAENRNRRWIGCDLGRWAIHTARKRLLEIENCKPFEVLNLGKYERQHWQTTKLAKKDAVEQAFFEYLAFILRLYKAQPIPGYTQLHGKKGQALVHIGAIDSPVTINEAMLAIEECAKGKQPELHILGWEWEMGLAGPNNGVKKGSPIHDIAKQKGIKLLLLQIPREVMEQQAVAQGDITFFELAYLSVEIKQTKNLHVLITLNDFVIPNSELIPEEVREKVKKWSDYIDYWAVDWDFQNDSFMQGWVTYRTRKDRSLALSSDVHKYEKPGTYRVLVKVVDIFGNDTSQAYTVEVK